MCKKEYDELKIKALNFIAKADSIERLDEKNFLLDQAEEIIENLKKTIEHKKNIAINKLNKHEINLKFKNVIEAMI